MLFFFFLSFILYFVFAFSRKEANSSCYIMFKMLEIIQMQQINVTIFFLDFCLLKISSASVEDTGYLTCVTSEVTYNQHEKYCDHPESVSGHVCLLALEVKQLEK